MDRPFPTKHFYKVELQGGMHMIAKLTQRYGAAVHTAWASVGVAPRLLECVALPGSWKLVVMEWLDEPWRPLDSLPPEVLWLLCSSGLVRWVEWPLRQCKCQATPVQRRHRSCPKYRTLPGVLWGVGPVGHVTARRCRPLWDPEA